MEEIILFHAGSLSKPLQSLVASFEKRNSGVKVLLEGSGARVAARKVFEEKRACDIVASADYEIIDNWLIPDDAKFNIHFVCNRMVLYFTDHSKYADQINAQNWFEILLKPEIQYGYTDPEQDPGGYRACFCWQLAEKYYQIPGLYWRLITKVIPANILTDRSSINSRLSKGELDYFFGYESGARQNNYRFLNLPDLIDLSSPEHAQYYK